jgi:transposase-like protein
MSKKKDKFDSSLSSLSSDCLKILEGLYVPRGYEEKFRKIISTTDAIMLFNAETREFILLLHVFDNPLQICYSINPGHKKFTHQTQ